MKKVTIRTLQGMYSSGEKVVMVTAYDATMARIMEDAGVDAILVGDSVGMVVQGHDSTIPVTLDHIVYHSAAVRRGAKRAHVVADMPFMSYQAGIDDAVRNAGRLVAEGGAEAVKLEGGADFADVVRRVVRAGIPVMGHIGLTPQSIHKLGGYGVQGRGVEAARALIEDARALEEAGCYCIVLECVPEELAKEVTGILSIPTIGIGAGAGCSGQVLVCYDLLGFNPDFAPRFLKRYADGYGTMKAAAEQYVLEVRSNAFPAREHSFKEKVPGRLHEVPGGRAIRVLDGKGGGGSLSKEPDQVYGSGKVAK